MKIEDAIQQQNFENAYQKLAINILYTAGWINQMNNATMRPFDLTWQQFNILRILRGRHPEPATSKLLSERMIDKMSNASRLVDKLEKKKYVERQNSTHDRRRVDIRLTEHGRTVVERAGEELMEELHRKMAHLDPSEANRTSELLDRLRTGHEPETDR